MPEPVGRGFLAKRPASVSPSLISLSSVLVAQIGKQSMSLCLPIAFRAQDTERITETNTLIDSGAGGNFLNKEFAERHGIQLRKLDRPTYPRNVDGTPLRRPKNPDQVIGHEHRNERRNTWTALAQGVQPDCQLDDRRNTTQSEDSERTNL